MRWGFVGIADPGETFDFACTSFLVQPFGIPLLADFQRRVDKNLDEVTAITRFDNLPASLVAIATIGADERRQRDQSGGNEKLANCGNPPNVLSAIINAKPKPESFRIRWPVVGEKLGAGIQSMTDIVAVQQIALGTQFVEPAVNRIGNGTLATAAQPREPDNTARLLQQVFPLLASNGMFVPGNVSHIAKREWNSGHRAEGSILQAELVGDSRQLAQVCGHHRLRATPNEKKQGFATPATGRMPDDVSGTLCRGERGLGASQGQTVGPRS